MGKGGRRGGGSSQPGEESSALQFVSHSDDNRCAAPRESLPRASPASCLSGLPGVFPPLPPDCLLLSLSSSGTLNYPPTQGSLLEAPRPPAQPLSWPPPRSQPKGAVGVGAHSGQGRLPGKHSGLFSSPPPAAPYSQSGVEGWFFPLTSTCPLPSPGCRGERLLMFSPEKMAPPPSRLLQGLAFPTSPQVGRPSESYTQCPLAVSASSLLS